MLHLLFPVYNYIHMFFQHLKEKRIKDKLSMLQMSQGMLYSENMLHGFPYKYEKVSLYTCQCRQLNSLVVWFLKLGLQLLS